MHWVLFIGMLIGVSNVFGQNDEAVIISQLKTFHASLNDAGKLSRMVHDSVSYGHSNGWIQTFGDLQRDAGQKTVYHSFKEDSIDVVMLDNVAYARFVADIDVSVNTNRVQYHLRVLEVWIKENEKWKLLARLAIK